MTSWKCPNCQGAIGPSPELAGQTVACPYCLIPVTIPVSVSDVARKRRRRMFVLFSLFVLGAGIGSTAILLSPSLPRPTWELHIGLSDFVPSHEKHPVQLAAYDESYHDIQQISSPSVSQDRPGYEDNAVNDGLGISRGQIIQKINDQILTEFADTTPRGGQPQVTASSDGAELILWGDPQNLQTITLTGTVKSDAGANYMASVISALFPSWDIEDANQWLAKSITKSDPDTFVSTVRDNVEITVAQADTTDSHWIFFQPDR